MKPRTEASIPQAEQEARRALKLERKALERSVTAGTVAYTHHSELPTGWSHARRGRESARSYDAAYRDTGARIGEIQRLLTEPRP
jgi:hypothetical protein